MPARDKSDFFLSRRGSVAGIAREVADVLTEAGYNVFTQDYDIPLGASFVEAMHEAIKNARDLIILYTNDYEASPYTRKEFTSFEAERAQSSEERRIVVLRCEDVPLRGLLADTVYQDLVGVDDPAERQRRIIAAAKGDSQAIPPPPRPFVGVPPRIASFTGRTGELDRLDAILVQDKPAVVTQAVGRAAVQGMGGVGKTSLAIEYAHRFRDLHAGVWWCPAEARNSLLTSLASLAVTLGAATADEADIEKAAKAGLRHLAEQRATWLLIYDNVATPEEIADLLPAAGARVLITSRFSDLSGWAEEVALDMLPISEAVAFLQNRTGRRDAAGARALSEALGCLPLALDHAAATCRRTLMCFADYATKVAKLIAAAPRGVAYPRSIAATFDLAIGEAVTQCPAAQELMAYFANCAPERIPMTLSNGGINDETQRLAALAALSEVSLIKDDPFEDGTPAVTVHRLVQAVARARSEAMGVEQDAVERLFARLAAIYPKDGLTNPRSWLPCSQLTPHLFALSLVDADRKLKFEKWPELLSLAGSYFHGRASYVEAAPLFRDALTIREDTLGAVHPHTATSLNNLASLLHDQGQFAEARRLYERTLAIYEKALGPEHPDTAGSLNNLANLLKDQGDLAAGQPLLERALTIYEKALGSGHPHTATILNNLASLLHELGDLAGAQPLYERALAIREKMLGPDHPYTATSLRGLAFLIQARGDLAGARPLYERALAIREKALGEDHPDTATTVSSIAFLLEAQGDLVDARLLYRRALNIYEKALGSEHPNTNRARYNLARVLLARTEEPTEALALAEAALVAHDKGLGQNHHWTVDSARVKADALRALGRIEEAATLRTRYGLTRKDDLHE